MAETNEKSLGQSIDISFRMQHLRIEIARLDREENHLVELLRTTNRNLTLSIAERGAMHRLKQSDVHHVELEIQSLQREADVLQRQIINLRTEKERYNIELQQLDRQLFELERNY